MVIKAILWFKGIFWVCKQLETYKIIKIVQAWIWFKYQTLWYFPAVFCFHSELNPSMFLIFPPEATSINSSSFHSVVPRLFASSTSSTEDFHVACLNSLRAWPSSLTFPSSRLRPLLGFPADGARRWHLAPSGHSDFFTFQMAAVEVTGVLGSVVYVVGTHMENEAVVLLGILFCVIFPAQSSFHVLTCVDR